jgi:hypothetical protein
MAVTGTWFNRSQKCRVKSSAGKDPTLKPSRAVVVHLDAFYIPFFVGLESGKITR